MKPADPIPGGGRVFLTGGTGLVGSHIAELLRAKGYGVLALHRRDSDLAHLRSIGAEFVEGCLEDGERKLASAMEGCDAVVHSAALVYSDLPWPRVREVNVEGTGSIFRAAARLRLPRGVFLSSVAVYGKLTGDLREDSPLDQPLRPRERYARSKREAERLVETIAGTSEMAAAVLRVSAVYGERDRLFTPRISRVLRLPVHPVLGSGRTPMSAVYAGNVAHAVLAALRGPLRADVRIFNVGDDHPLTQRQLLNALAESLGIRFRPFSVPGGLVASLAHLADAIGLRIAGAEEMPLRRMARLAVQPNPYKSDRIRDELGWVSPVSLDQALSRTGSWIAGTTESSDDPTVVQETAPHFARVED